MSDGEALLFAVENQAYKPILVFFYQFKNMN
jgi:hypothetical protein